MVEKFEDGCVINLGGGRCVAAEVDVFGALLLSSSEEEEKEEEEKNLNSGRRARKTASKDFNKH